VFAIALLSTVCNGTARGWLLFLQLSFFGLGGGLWFCLQECPSTAMSVSAARAKDYSFGSSGPKGSQQETNPERLFKLKEVCDLLLAAGYHRARVTALTPFDRVVGGMVWAMTNSNFDVDIDILFTENATIGQRMSVRHSTRPLTGAPVVRSLDVLCVCAYVFVGGGGGAANSLMC
jgi:hypothetical protein